MTPLRSLLIKLGLLGCATLLAAWIGWPVDDPAEGPIAVDPRPATVSPLPRPAAPPPAQRPSRPAKLDLNRATPQQLEELPGIGQVLASRMIARRERTGGFTAVDDLLTVKGIGAKRLEQLRPLVTVTPTRRSSARPSQTAQEHL